MAKVDPFLLNIPKQLQSDPETRGFFEYLIRWAHDITQRTGGGNDLIAETQIGELYEPGIQTFDPGELVSELFQDDGATLADALEHISDLSVRDDGATLADVLERISELECDFDQFLPQAAGFDQIYGDVFGFFDYNDSSGTTSLVANTWTDLPNNGLGGFTNKTFRPKNVNDVLDTSTGYLNFTELPLGSEIVLRNDFTVTPHTNNCLLEARYLLGTGAGQYPLQFWSERLDSGSGIPYQRVTSFPIYMGDSNTQQNPGKLQVKLSAPGTIVNAGIYVSVRVKS